MRMRVVALSASDYAAWQANQLEDAKVPTDALAKKGMETFRTSCSGCHLVSGPGGNDDVYKGTAQVSGAAPNLTHFASRGVFAGGVFDTWVDQNGNGEIDIAERGKQLNVADLEAWLRDPPGRKPMYPEGSRGMPNLNLTDEQIKALVAYLETLE